MRDLFVAGMMFATLPAALYRPFAGALAWALISYMNPHKLSWGFAATVPFAMLVALTTIASWIISQEKKTLPRHPLVYLLIAFTVWFTITTIMGFSENSSWRWTYWDRVIKIFLMVLITVSMLNTRERIHALVWVSVIALGFFGVKGGAFTIMTGGGGRVIGPPQTMIGDNNHLAVALIMVLPFIRYLQLQSQIKWVRMVLLAAMLLVGIAIIGSFSRGAFLAGIAMMIYLFFKSRQKWIIAIAGAAVIIFTINVMPQEYFDRLESIEAYEEDGSAMGRINSWTFGFRVANNHFFGGGFESYTNYRYYFQLVPEAFAALAYHSIYFSVLGDQGWVGLGIFLLIGATALMSLNVIRRRTSDRPDLQWAYDLASMAQVSLVGYAVGGAFLSLAYFDFYYNIIAIIIGLHVVVRRSLQEEASGHAIRAGPRAVESTRHGISAHQ